MMFAETVASFDVTDVIVALTAAVSAISVAFVGAGAFTKRNVKKGVQSGVEAAVTGVSDAEIAELQGIRSELEMMRSAQTASNNLAAATWATMDRRVNLIEMRLDSHEGRLESIEKV